MHRVQVDPIIFSLLEEKIDYWKRKPRRERNCLEGTCVFNGEDLVIYAIVDEEE